MNFAISIRYNDTSFRITFDYASKSTKADVVLEEIFAQWNAGSGRESSLFLRSSCRSLSVGDYVKVNDQWYRCASFGWDEVSEDNVELWFNEMELCRQNRMPGKTEKDERLLCLYDRRKVENKLGVFS